MTCQRLEEWMSEYLADELAAVQREELQRHLEVCAECRTELEEAEELLLGEAPVDGEALEVEAAGGEGALHLGADVGLEGGEELAVAAQLVGAVTAIWGMSTLARSSSRMRAAMSHVAMAPLPCMRPMKGSSSPMSTETRTMHSAGMISRSRKAVPS